MEQIEIKTKNNYHDLYLKCNVLLLADVFEKFRNNSLNNYDNAQYDKNVHDIYIFFEKSMRGGVSYISNRYSKVNKSEILKPKTRIKTYYILRREKFVWLCNI